MIPEVLGNKNSLVSESFQNHLIEYPQFTKPRVWQNLEVPEILLNGNHEKVSEWKLKTSIEVTKEKGQIYLNYTRKSLRRKMNTLEKFEKDQLESLKTNKTFPNSTLGIPLKFTSK